MIKIYKCDKRLIAIMIYVGVAKTLFEEATKSSNITKQYKCMCVVYLHFLVSLLSQKYKLLNYFSFFYIDTRMTSHTRAKILVCILLDTLSNSLLYVSYKNPKKACTNFTTSKICDNISLECR